MAGSISGVMAHHASAAASAVGEANGWHVAQSEIKQNNAIFELAATASTP